MLTGAQPKACTVGELKLKPSAIRNLDRYLCSCGQPIRQCGFWSGVSAAMRDKGHEFDLASADTSVSGIDNAFARRLLEPLHRGPLLEAGRDMLLNSIPGWRAYLARAQARVAALVESVQELSGAEVVVDSSKNGVGLKYLLRNPGLDIRVLRLIRDGRGVALTYVDPERFADATDPERRSGGFGGEPPADELSMAMAAREWRRSNEEAENVLARLPESQWMEVRYERLCTDTEETLRAICQFLGLPSTDVVLDFRATEHHVVGNGMRLDATSQIVLDERWRERLTPEDLEIFESIAGSLNRRYGYRQA